jgi:hypothetical protein
VADDYLAVFGEVNISFDDFLAVFPGQLVGGDGVFGGEIGFAAMRGEEGFGIFEPARGGASEQQEQWQGGDELQHGLKHPQRGMFVQAPGTAGSTMGGEGKVKR